MTAEEEQRKLQALMMRIRSYQGLLQDLSRQAALAEAAIADLTASIQAIEELPKSKEDEAMIPIGAGVFTKAKLLDKKNVVVAISRKISVEKTTVEAKKYLEGKKTQLEENEAKVKDQVQKINMEMEAANQEAEALYMKLQGK